MASLGNELGNPLGNVLGNPLSGGVGASYQAILGPLLVELWDARLGISTVSGNVDTWTGQLLGTVLQAPAAGNRPPYATDGANFRGRPVVLAANTGSKCLITANLSPALFAAGARPWLWSCCRIRTVSVASNNTFLEVVDNPVTRAQPVFYTLGSALISGEGATAGSLPLYSDSTVHSYSCAYSSAGAIETVIDGVVAASAGTGLSAQNSGGSKLSVGGAFNGTSPADGSFATLLVIRSQPSPAQIAALVALDKATWGF